ncbi:MAG TPA: hypothetical protein VH518_11800 [Tepidisphaeraceae bacterium]|jgi:hypothetical protein
MSKSTDAVAAAEYPRDRHPRRSSWKGFVMSSIDAIGGGLSQFLQSISGSPSPTSSAPVVTPNTTDGQQDGTEQAQGAHHHHHRFNSAQFAEIKDAVTSALQAAKDDPSADPNKAVEDAIAKALQGGTSDTAPTANQPADTNPAVASSTVPSDAKQAFGQLLQSYGVSAQQFHQDFLAAMKDAQAGNVDPSTALKSFPPGMSLDETA